MLRSKILVCLAMVAIFIVACQPKTVEVTRIVSVTLEVTQAVTRQIETVTTEVVMTQPLLTPTPAPIEYDEPVTLYEYLITDIPEMDPQVMSDLIGVTYAENLFVTLTNYDLETTEIMPEAATEWEISRDGLTYTFHIRTDIPWVYHNPTTEETVQVLDAEGNPRFVTAHDFVYSIKRACDPRLGSYYSSVIAPIIRGCLSVLEYSDPNNIPPELIDTIGVNAPDESTLIIQLENPTSFFLSMTPLWTLSATPQWTIDEYGQDWTEAGTIVTSGRYVLHEWIHNVRITVLRNSFMPEDMWGKGNIERQTSLIIPDSVTGYALWLKGEVETATIPDPELQTHLEQFPDETLQIPELGVFYIGFRMTKAPFDNVHVRRAFSAAFDRETYVQEVRQGQGLPMRHFAPPGIFGAPAIDEVGVGFDPEFAQEQLAEAGYPNCNGFPSVTIMGSTSATTRSWIEFAQSSWETHLGCSSDLINMEQVTFADLLAATDANVPDEQAPHMWTLSWFADYADENNWVGDVLWCGNSQNRNKRTCSATDDLIVEARLETELNRRVELYHQIEENFFGQEGEFPFAPIFLRLGYAAVHSWYEVTTPLFGGAQWYNYSIDQQAQAEARQGN